MSTQYQENVEIQSLVTKIKSTVERNLQFLKTECKVQLLHQLLQRYLNNSGIVFVIVQILIVSLTNSLKSDQKFEIASVLKDSKDIIRFYSTLVQKYLFFNQNQRISEFENITDSIVLLLANVNITE